MNEDSKAQLITRMILVAEEPGFCRATKWPEVQGAVPGGAEGRGGVGDFRGVYTPHPTPHRPTPHRQARAAGGPCPCPLTPFHLLCFHSEPPPLQLWDRAPRAPSDPPGSVSVAAHPSSSLSASPVIFFSQNISIIYF